MIVRSRYTEENALWYQIKRFSYPEMNQMCNQTKFHTDGKGQKDERAELTQTLSPGHFELFCLQLIDYRIRPQKLPRRLRALLACYVKYRQK